MSTKVISVEFDRKAMQILQGVRENCFASSFDNMTDDELVLHCLSKGLKSFGISKVELIKEEN